ncbi:DNA ligase 4-like [Planoprotostelium fungivorum]|uniref:DNA ligase n=1 Tax=Planoprotostelium fungivorum TaxID=1890364 RepID=A0A2P6MRQ6_9EUKA|nr:DNA ligase 4-like [Planoprotostelium fungivorum]
MMDSEDNESNFSADRNEYHGLDDAFDPNFSSGDQRGTGGSFAALVPFSATFFGHYKDDDFFPLLRLLLPQLDKERQSYGMKETVLGRHYVEILNIAPNSDDAQRLIHWKRPGKTAGTEDKVSGDFGTAVYTSLRTRCPATGTMSVMQLNETLDQLNAATERVDRIKVLKHLLRKTTATEQKWIVRIILKDLKIGMSEKTILQFFHPDALQLFNVSSNLRAVCQELKTPGYKVGNASSESINLFNPIKPMLASRHAPENVIKAMNGDPFIVEEKFDGERVQIHKNGREIKLFSRNANDVTGIYGAILTPVILGHVLVSRCIIDGELVVWDEITQRFEEFGKLKTFATNARDMPLNKSSENTGKQLCYVAFDLLYVNNRSVMDLTLSQRMVLLKRCIRTKARIIEVVEQREAKTVEDITEALDQAILKREEGIMIKNLNATYVPNERKGRWIKLKPEYIDGVGDNLDLLIVGGYYGSGVGRRGGTVSHFLLAVAVPDEERAGGIKALHSFCKVGSGYSDEQLKQLQKVLEPHWRPFNNLNPPNCFQLAEPLREKPDLWIQPKDSKILQVKGAQIIPSDKYRTGVTLRFPRVMNIRMDKMWSECTTTTEIEELTKEFGGRFGKRKASETETKEKTKKVKTVSVRKAKSVLSSLRGIDANNVEVTSRLFDGWEFCVMNGEGDVTKQELETIVVQNGGTVVQYPNTHTRIILAGKKSLKVQNLIDGGSVDVVNQTWLTDVSSQGSLIPLQPKYMLYTTPQTKINFLKEIDRFGDSFTTAATTKSLNEAFEQVEKQMKEGEVKTVRGGVNTSEDILLFEKKYFDGKCWWAHFRQFKVYLDRYAVLGDPTTSMDNCPLELTEHVLKFYGATILDCIGADTTHIIMDREDITRLDTIKKVIKRMKFARRPPFVVTREWVEESANSHEDLDEDPFRQEKKHFPPVAQARNASGGPDCLLTHPFIPRSFLSAINRLVSVGLGACVDVSSFQKWSSVPQWNQPKADVTIAAGTSVLLDVAPSAVLGVIKVSGHLYFSNTNMDFKSNGIVVNSGGILTVGSSDCPITNKVYITLYGHPNNFTNLGRDPVNEAPTTVFGGKAIIVATGGSVQMYGRVNGPTWTFLSSTAVNGSSLLNLRDAVQWAVNDRIVIASTDFSEVFPGRGKYNTTNAGGQSPMGTMTSGGSNTYSFPEQSEEFTILAVKNGGRTILLNRPLNYTHWGQGYMRAEVGWLTRKIVVRGDESSDVTSYGGHTLFRNGPVTSLYGVEFTRMGQKGFISRYPVHFHNMGSVVGKNKNIENCAVHHVYQRCITIHETDGAIVKNNVAYKTHGHCYFIEDGAETLNEFIGNLGIYAQPMFPPLLPHDVQPSIFWITNPNNTFINNSASSAFIAYWMAMPLAPTGLFGETLWNVPGKPTMQPRNSGFGPGGFHNNIAHSLYKDGFHIDSMPNADQSMSTGSWFKAFNVTNFVSYKTRHGSVWSRFASGTYYDNVWMDSGEAHILMSDSQLIIRTTFVGESDNTGLITTPLSAQFGRSMPNANGQLTYIGGYRGYDNGGSQTLINCTFVNFTANALRGAGAVVNSDNSQWGTTALQKLFNVQYINSVSHYTMVQRLQFMFNGSANCLAYQDASGTSLGYKGGAWLVSNQTIYGATEGCTPKYESNGYICKPWGGTLTSVQVNSNVNFLRFSHNSDPLSQDKYNITTDTTVYGHWKMDGIIFRKLGSTPTSPFFLSNSKTNIFSNTFYHILPFNHFGRRTGMQTNSSVAPRALLLGEWLVFAMPYPNGTTFHIEMPDGGAPLGMAKSMEHLSPWAPFWNAKDNHLYLLVTNDFRGAPSNSTGGGYVRDIPYIGFRTYKINASCHDCRTDKYVVPPMPNPLPIVLRRNNFRAELTPVAPSTTGHVGTIFAQLYPYSYFQLPSLTVQIWHSIYGDARDLYVSIVDEHDNLLTDNLVGHSTYTTRFPVSIDFWAKLISQTVFVSLRDMKTGKELMRGRLTLEANQIKLSPPTLKKTLAGCNPTHAIYNIFDDHFSANDTVNPVVWKTSTNSYCGSNSLYFDSSSKPRLYFTPTKNCNIKPKNPIPSQYKSIEFYVKLVQPFQNMNYLNITVSANYYDGKNNSFQNSPSTYVSQVNTANAVVNSRGWTLVRVNLKDLGGANITCLGFDFLHWWSHTDFLIDNIRFSSLAVEEGFYDSPIVPPLRQYMVDLPKENIMGRPKGNRMGAMKSHRASSRLSVSV